MSRRRSLSYIFGGTASIAVLNLILSIGISRVLGAERYGVVALLLLPSQVAMALTTVGEQIYLLRTAAGTEETERGDGLLLTVAAVSGSFTTGVALVVIPAMYLLLRGVFTRNGLGILPVALVGISMTLFTNFTVLTAVYLTGKGRYVASTILRAVQSLLGSVFLLIAGFVSTSIVWYATSYVSSAAIAALVAWRLAGLRLAGARSQYSPRIRRELTATVKTSWAGVIAGNIAPSLILIAVSTRYNAATIGVFSRCVNLVVRCAEFPVRLTEVIVRDLSNTVGSASDKHRGVQSTLRRNFRHNVVILEVALLGAAVMSPFILRVFGKEFDNGASLLTLLLIGLAIETLVMLPGATLIHYMRFGALNRIELVRSATYVGGVFVVTRMADVESIGIVRVVTSIGMLVIMTWKAWTVHRSHEPVEVPAHSCPPKPTATAEGVLRADK